MQNWISINDKLPEPGEDVVATDGMYCEVGFYSALGWCDFHFEVTHWLPIPPWIDINEPDENNA